MKADSVCICFAKKHHYKAHPWFSFSLFYILSFSVHIVNFNTAKSGTGLDNLSVNIYIYIYKYFFFFGCFCFSSSGRNLRNITCLLFP